MSFFKTLIASFMGLLVTMGLAHADALTDITAKVNTAMTSGETIATAIVLGLFAIWAVKLLWKSK